MVTFNVNQTAFGFAYIEFALAVCAQLDGKKFPDEWLEYPRIGGGVNGVHFIEAAVCTNAGGGTWETIRVI